jgi:hypothetical protein
MVLDYGERRFLFSFALLEVKDLPFQQVANRLLEIEAEVSSTSLSTRV